MASSQCPIMPAQSHNIINCDLTLLYCDITESCCKITGPYWVNTVPCFVIPVPSLLCTTVFYCILTVPFVPPEDLCPHRPCFVIILPYYAVTGLKYVLTQLWCHPNDLLYHHGTLLCFHPLPSCHHNGVSANKLLYSEILILVVLSLCHIVLK